MAIEKFLLYGIMNSNVTFHRIFHHRSSNPQPWRDRRTVDALARKTAGWGGRLGGLNGTYPLSVVTAGHPRFFNSNSQSPEPENWRSEELENRKFWTSHCEFANPSSPPMKSPQYFFFCNDHDLSFLQF